MHKITAGLIVLTLAGGVLFAAPKKQPSQVREIMRQKLEHAQKVLEGVAVEDFKSIAENAQAMALLAQAASWQVYQTPEYAQHTTEFRRACDELARMARAKNLDGSALAYVDLTMKCVNCHKYVRGVRVASLDSKPLPVSATKAEATSDGRSE